MTIKYDRFILKEYGTILNRTKTFVPIFLAKIQNLHFM